MRRKLPDGDKDKKKIPEKYQQYQLKKKERYKKKKETGIMKQVKDMTPSQLRRTRRAWRKNQRSKREKDRKLSDDVRRTLSPPPTPTPDEDGNVINPQNDARRQTMRRLGRRKVKKNRAKAYRELFKLRIQLNNERRLKEKYKKCYNRLKNEKTDNDPIKASTARIIKNKEEWLALLLHNIITKQIKDRYCQTRNQEYRSSFQHSFDGIIS